MGRSTANLETIQPEESEGQPEAGGSPPGQQGSKPGEKAYGYTYDNNHEAALEAKLIRQISALAQVHGNKVPVEIQGDIQTLITEIRGFLRKWKVFTSYAEKCSMYVGDHKHADVFIVNCLYNDFMKWADKLGFKNPTNVQEKWEKRFLGLSS